VAIHVIDYIDRLPPEWRPRSQAQTLALACPAEVLCYGGSVGSLKANQIGLFVPTPDGGKLLEDVHVGDKVFAEDGTVCTVTAESAIYTDKKCYEIEFDNGEKIIAADDHRWLTMTDKERTATFMRTEEWRAARRAKRPTRQGKIRKPRPDLVERNWRTAEAKRGTLMVPTNGTLRTTQEIFETQQHRSGYTNHSIDVCAPLQLPTANLLVNPYVLGAWLGDGSRDGGGFAGIDIEIIEEIRAAGYETNKSKSSDCCWYIKNIRPKLRTIGVLMNKHIPIEYMRASFEQRLALLQGLMDTDGSAPSGRSTIFYNSNEALANQVRELLHTLGIKASKVSWESHYINEEGRRIECGPTFGISFSTTLSVFRLPRKLAAKNAGDRPTNQRHYIVAVRPVPTVPTKCIAVDSPSHLFLVSRSFIPTHNSETVLVDALRYQQQPKYSAVIFRRTFPETEFLIQRTRDLYAHAGGQFYEGAKQWKWPWGATISFRHLDQPKDVYKYQGFEYQYIAFDESTHQPEMAVRYLLQSRMRSVNEIPLRMRLATNPGNIGAAWHKALFHGKRCIHCVTKSLQEGATWPKDVRHYGAVYADAVWPSDKKPLNHTTCYIPGKVTDHSLFGEGGGKYMEKLRGLPVALQEALLEGCWEAFEDQYFDCFDLQEHVIERSAIAERSWWPYWVGIDYGFRHACVAYLFTKAPDGTVYVLDEYVTHQKKGVDVALDIEKRWSTDHRLKALYLSPDTFAHDGKTDFSQAEMMSQATSLAFDQAYNDRVSGWLLCYQLMQQGKLQITRDCPLLIEAIPTRVHAHNYDGDLEKQADDYDDACLVAGTQVTTADGTVSIEQIQIGTLVATRQGLKPVSAAWKTGIRACVTVVLNDGTSITGTMNHPIWICGRGYTRLDTLQYGDVIIPVWQKQSYLMESSSGDTQNPVTEVLEFTIGRVAQTLSKAFKVCIKKCGKRQMGQFLRNMIYTIGTKIHSTIICPTWNACLNPHIIAYTPEFMTSKPLSIWQPLDHWRRNGTPQKLEENGTGNMPVKVGTSACPAKELAHNAAMALNQPPGVANFALTPASQSGVVAKALMTLLKFAKDVRCRLKQINTKTISFVHGGAPFVTKITLVGEHEVYNITVNDAHEYFANGVLTRNCDAFRYGIASEIRPGERPEEDIIQERIDSGEWGSDPTSIMLNRMFYHNQHGGSDSTFNYRQRGGGGPRTPRTSKIFNIK